MTARVLDATKIRDQVFAALRDEIGRLATEGIRKPFAPVLRRYSSANPASNPYVKIKIAAMRLIFAG